MNENEEDEMAHAGRRDRADKHDVGTKNLPRQRMMTVVGWVSMVIIVVALVTIVGSLPTDYAMMALKNWISGLGVWGPVAFVLVYIVGTVLFVPGTILTLVAGAMFGLGVGMVTASIGSTVGASLAFLISRYVARDKIAVMAGRNRRFGAIDQAIADGGWKIVALLRLSPVTPFTLENYLYGLTRIHFWPYVLTSWLAMLPGTGLYVYLGHVTGAAVGADRVRTPWEWTLLAVGLLATAVAMVYLTRLAHSKLQKQMGQSTVDDEVPPIALDEDRGATRHTVCLRNTVILAAVALMMIGVAAMVYVSAGTLAEGL